MPRAGPLKQVRPTVEGSSNYTTNLTGSLSIERHLVSLLPRLTSPSAPHGLQLEQDVRWAVLRRKAHDLVGMAVIPHLTQYLYGLKNLVL
jgi:hypothetical protein